jgi:uncharacterized protein YqjF (DUF2071 family)
MAFLPGDVALQRRSLAETSHRPWPLPTRPWVMGQTWHDLLFAHWAVPAEGIERLLPPPLRPQLYGGRAWLGVTPFVVSGVHPRGAPPLPWLSRFPELNVRTYVEVGGKPGIYFFSLDAARVPAVWAARRAYLLPYFHARMSRRQAGAEIRFESTRSDRSGPAAAFSGAYQATGPTTEDPLARWLAERYCLYVVDRHGRVLRGDIHHPPWPLQPAEGELAAQGMATPLGIDLEGKPLLHYSARQDVVFWRLAQA